MVSRIQYVQSGQYSNVIGTSKGNAATCNYGQKNTLCATMVSGIQYVQLWSAEYDMYNQVSISYVNGMSKSNVVPFFLLLLKVSIPSMTKDMELEDLAFCRMSDITQTVDSYTTSQKRMSHAHVVVKNSN